MRLTKEFTELLAKNIVRSLLDKDLIIWEDSAEKLQTIINGIITEDLMVEDRLNEEVKTLNDVRLDITRVMTDILQLDDKADAEARRILNSYSNAPREGSPEWDIMYQKHFDEYMNKQSH
jgi:uncharacterized protein